MKYFILIFFILAGTAVKAQKVDSIYVNLYTDSLKKGTYNYINVDGRLTNGRYIPLDSNHLIFKSSHGTFKGNSLWLEPDCREKYVDISITLRDKPEQTHKLVLYVKTKPDDEQLKTSEQILEELKQGTKKKRKEKEKS
ncbi:MAG: hypothetical protein ABIY51_13720 [Ferruginibacter sp.]